MTFSFHESGFFLLLSTAQWLHAAVDVYNVIQTSLFKAEMRNRVDEILFVGKLSAISILPAPDHCCIAEARAKTDI